MGDKTGISWTDATWNPVRGCSRVSEGCRHCYAESMAFRIMRMGASQKYNRLIRTVDGDPRWTGEVAFDLHTLADPLRWKKPRRIFVNSMSDLFHENLTSDQIAAVFGVMAACPQHTFQVLTKRARRMREWFEWIGALGTLAAIGPEAGAVTECHALALGMDLDETIHTKSNVPEPRRWPLSNVWIGVSVENQAAADERIPELLLTPAAVRFLSCEPLIGPVDLLYAAFNGADSLSSMAGIDWVIAGCESGSGARPCKVEWLRSLRDQCAAASVPYFLKQASDSIAEVTTGADSKRKPGGIIELPYLDGVQHAAFPTKE